mgnify:CR=1 FL=1
MQHPLPESRPSDAKAVVRSKAFSPASSLCEPDADPVRSNAWPFCPRYGAAYVCTLAVLMDNCRGLGSGVDAPLVCQPASVEGVSTKQTHGCDQNDDQRVHFFYLFPLLFMRQRGHAVVCCLTEYTNKFCIVPFEGAWKFLQFHKLSAIFVHGCTEKVILSLDGELSHNCF